MDKAANFIVDTLETGAPAAVFADYDVDGATSAAILVRFFRAFGRELILYVPDRLNEGYGPSAEAFARLKAQGVERIFTVDCGAAAADALKAGADMGLSICVLDHHLMSGEPPPAVAVVNPNRPDDASGCGYMAAAGVSLVAIAAAARRLRERGGPLSDQIPDLLSFLDLSALGTLCDVAPLIGANRAIVSKGLKKLNAAPTLGLRALTQAAGLATARSPYHATFMLGPRLNAGGRVGEAWLAATLLCTDDEAEAARLAARLHGLNEARREIEAQIVDEAIAMVEAKLEHAPETPIAFAAKEGWHPGVIGIVAGRLKERFQRPSFVLGWGEGLGPNVKGSGRSIDGVNLGDAVSAAAKSGVIAGGGGHAMAAGASLTPDQIPAFEAYLSNALRAPFDAAEEARRLRIDALVTADAADVALVDELSRAGPFGAGAPEPVFAIADVRLFEVKRMGDGTHLRLIGEDSTGGRIEGVAFRVADSPLGDLLEARGAVHLAGRLSRNEWRDRVRVQLELIDAAPAR